MILLNKTKNVIFFLVRILYFRPSPPHAKMNLNLQPLSRRVRTGATTTDPVPHFESGSFIESVSVAEPFAESASASSDSIVLGTRPPTDCLRILRSKKMVAMKGCIELIKSLRYQLHQEIEVSASNVWSAINWTSRHLL
jgi:hypothetical protein